MPASVPVIEIADNTDAKSIRRPYREMHTADAQDTINMRTQFVIQALVRALTDQMQIQFAEMGRESVWIVDVAGPCPDFIHAQSIASLLRPGKLPTKRPVELTRSIGASSVPSRSTSVTDCACG